MDKVYDMIIVGSGPGGLTAAIYSARSLRPTLIIEKLGAGGQMALTLEVENYPGFEEVIGGFELSERMEAQAKRLGTEFAFDTVLSVTRKDDQSFEVKTQLGKTYYGKSILVSTGATPKPLPTERADHFYSKGVSYCATCDGAFFRDKEVAVVGGGNSALEEALFLTRFASKVYIIHRRDTLRADKTNQNRTLAHPKIHMLWNTVLTELHGDSKVESITVQNVQDQTTQTLDVKGVFAYIGTVPATDWIDLEKDEKGFIVVDSLMQTSEKGIFAAGDCTNRPFKQIATAVGDGAMANYSMEHYLSHMD